MARIKRLKRTPDLTARLLLLPIALYVRFSVNPDGSSDSTKTQIKVGLAWIADRWPGREVIIYEDDGISASNDDTYRPRFEQMLADIADGKVGAVASRWQARISRSELTWPRFKKACLSVGIDTLNTWIEGDIAIAPGKSLGGDVGNLMHSHTSATIKESILETLDLHAQEGRPSGGRAYGYRHVRNGSTVELVIRDEQADIIREAARMLLDGYSLTDVAKELNRRDVPTPRGGRAWTASTVKAVVSKETVGGHRMQNGEITAKGTWTAILDEDTWRAVRSLLSAPRKITRSDGRTYTRKVGRNQSRAYPLSGEFTVCARCWNAGGLVAMTHYPKKGDPKPMYACHSKNGGCDGLGIFAVALEDHVLGVVKAELANKRTVRRLMAQDDVDAGKRLALEKRKATAELRLQEAADAWDEGELSLAGYQKADAKATATIAGLDEQIGKLTLRKETEIDWDAVRVGFDDLAPAKQRNVMRRLKLRVDVYPASGPRVSNPRGRTAISFDGKPWAGNGQRPAAVA